MYTLYLWTTMYTYNNKAVITFVWCSGNKKESRIQVYSFTREHD